MWLITQERAGRVEAGFLPGKKFRLALRAGKLQGQCSPPPLSGQQAPYCCSSVGREKGGMTHTLRVHKAQLEGKVQLDTARWLRSRRCPLKVKDTEKNWETRTVSSPDPPPPALDSPLPRTLALSFTKSHKLH